MPRNAEIVKKVSLEMAAAGGNKTAPDNGCDAALRSLNLAPSSRGPIPGLSQGGAAPNEARGLPCRSPAPALLPLRPLALHSRAGENRPRRLCFSITIFGPLGRAPVQRVMWSNLLPDR